MTAEQPPIHGKPKWSLDLVTVAFTGELLALKLQARSIALFVAKGTFDTIYVIVNDNDWRGFRQYFEQHVLPEYGAHETNVELVDGRQLAQQKIPKNGWRSQQPLKLLISKLITAQQYLVLDSKNHFIRPFDQANVMAQDGRMISHTYPVIERFIPYYDAACRYFDLPEVGQSRPRVLPTSTPFVFSAYHASRLVSEVESREEVSFFKFFMASKAHTEFYLYAVFLTKTPGLMADLYEFGDKPNVTLFSSSADDETQAQEAIKSLQDETICLFGVHRDVFEAGKPSLLDTIAQVWCDFGLVSDQKEAEAFMVPGVPYRRRRRLF